MLSVGTNPKNRSKTRMRIFQSLVIIIGLVFIGRLAQLQIVESVFYQQASQAQAIKRVRIEPFRGNIFDRNDSLLVHNESSFSLTLTKNQWLPESFNLLTSILNVDTTEFQGLLTKYKGYSPFIPIKLYRDLDINTISGIEEYNDYLRGIEVITESKRLYQSDARMSHLLGFTREISRKELDNLQYYHPGDVIGKQGLEKEYETILRGEEGVKYVAVNKFGQQVAKYDNGLNDRNSRNGFDLYLGLDNKIQKKAEELLLGKRGAIVAIEPESGEILAIASSPNYNLSEFSGRISPEFYNSLISDDDKPLLDRTVNSQYPPGSSWKMLIALAGLEEGIIDENSTYYCKGGYQRGRFYKCLGFHGNINVTRALKKSCNAFFYQLSLDLGMEKVHKYASRFNFGRKTDVDLPSENSGNFPSTDELEKEFDGKIPDWKLINFGIGQGEILVTPLQMASYIAAIANGKYYNQPHAVRKIYNNVSKKFEDIDFDKRELSLSPSTVKTVKQGMWEVVNAPGGTGARAKIPGLDVCGKTSTAQNPHGKDHGWFTCFAPRENPKIAIAVMVENAGWGGTVCAPIAKELLLEFFYPERSNINNQTAPSDSTNNSADSLQISLQ